MKPLKLGLPLSMSLAVLLSALPLTASAQRAVPRGEGRSSPPAPAGRTASGGDHGGKIASGDARSSGGDQSTGGSSGGDTVKRAPAADEKVQETAPHAAVKRESGNGDAASSSTDAPARTKTIPAYSRPRGSNPAVGEAVPRRGRPPLSGDDGTVVLVPGGYYGGYYPWGYGGFGVGGYYGGYYDPWYYGPYQPYAGSYDYDGRLRLKVKPRSAEVLVDGYYSGVVDEFDGTFQRLHIEPGPHRIEIREEGYEPLSFDVRIMPDRTVTYTGELRKTSN